MRPKFTCAGSIPSPRNREKYICICKIKQTLGCVNSTQVARGTQDAGFTQPSLHLFLQVHMRRLPRTACYFSARARAIRWTTICRSRLQLINQFIHSFFNASHHVFTHIILIAATRTHAILWPNRASQVHHGGLDK